MMEDYYQINTKLSSLSDKNIFSGLFVAGVSFLATCSPADAEQISEPQGGHMAYYQHQQDLSGYTNFFYRDETTSGTSEEPASRELEDSEVVGSFLSRLTNNIREPIADVHKEIVSRPWDFV